MAPTDNPWLTSLQAEWVGKILYDGGYFRVVQVQYVPNQGNNRYPCWEATYEPVYFNNGQYVVHDRNVSVGQNGRRVILKSSLVGFALAEYSNGDNADPVVLPHAANFHAAFLKRKTPKPACSIPGEGVYVFSPVTYMCTAYKLIVISYPNNLSTLTLMLYMV